jgi:hypothetical protein
MKNMGAVRPNEFVSLELVLSQLNQKTKKRVSLSDLRDMLINEAFKEYSGEGLRFTIENSKVRIQNEDVFAFIKRVLGKIGPYVYARDLEFTLRRNRREIPDLLRLLHEKGVVDTVRFLGLEGEKFNIMVHSADVASLKRIIQDEA